ncbi:MAG: carboxypeptidase-like regulatory domain-containing protein [Planctomycetota bacterium]
MKQTTPTARCSTLLLSCLLLAGCGSSDGLATVKGKVTLNGQPLEGAIVEFQPVIAGGAPSAGKTDANGRYELMYTFKTPGAMPGDHTVSIRTGGTCFDDEGDEVERPERLPARYNSQTELNETVQPGKNTINFEL